MSARELDAAGITRPELRAAYSTCRQLNAEHGRTYYLASLFLPPERRPAVHALYGFARYVDDIVDVVDTDSPVDVVDTDSPVDVVDTDSPVDVVDTDSTGPRARLDALENELRHALRTGTSTQPVISALIDTATRYRIEHRYFTDFLTSMRMDLTIDRYPTREALGEYVYGSAEVIGRQMVPVLGTITEESTAAYHAAQLGHAFQLTNFLRDVAEDLDRGRVYLPSDELAAFGVDRERLLWCRHRGAPDAPVRRALADQVARTRAVYRDAEPGIAMLEPISRPCMRTAYTLYAEILDHIVDSNYHIFDRRIRVPRTRRAHVGAHAAVGTIIARLRRFAS